MKSKYVPPQLAGKLFPDYVWKSQTDKIFLTFDDGPVPETTPIILKELQKLNIHVMFFCVGENIQKNTTLCEDILSAGHQIGNHTFNHARITWFGRLEWDETIRKVNELVEEKLNYQVKFFRPPYGRINFKINPVLKKYDLKNVMWSLLPYDYKNDLNIVKFAIQNYLQDNSIVVLHDSLKSKKIIIESINILAEEVEKKGYKFGNPSECLNYSF